jgi:DNA topoisomerase IA
MGIMEAGLGRPSTLPSHIMKLLEQKVLGEDFRPNGKGRAALALAPKEIADSRFTVRMEWTSRESKNQKSDVKETMGKILAVVSDDVRFRMEESLEEKLPSIESFSISSKKEENIGLGM